MHRKNQHVNHNIGDTPWDMAGELLRRPPLVDFIFQGAGELFNGFGHQVPKANVFTKILQREGISEVRSSVQRLL